MQKIKITLGSTSIEADLLDTPTAEEIYKRLPFDSSAQIWGDEIYFTTPVFNIALEKNAKQIVELGELSFWVEGNCIAIGFGPTPISHGNEIRLATRTNIWAVTQDDLKILKNTQAGEKVSVNAIA